MVYGKHAPNWAPSHSSLIMSRLQRNIFPWLGGKPIADINASQLLEVVRRIEQRGALETCPSRPSELWTGVPLRCGDGARRARPVSRFAWRIVPRKEQALRCPHRSQDRSAPLLRVLDGYEGSLIVRCALRLAPLVFVRPGELRRAEWKDIDLEAAEWRFTVTKTDNAAPCAPFPPGGGGSARTQPADRTRALCLPQWSHAEGKPCP